MPQSESMTVGCCWLLVVAVCMYVRTECMYWMVHENLVLRTERVLQWMQLMGDLERAVLDKGKESRGVVVALENPVSLYMKDMEDREEEMSHHVSRDVIDCFTDTYGMLCQEPEGECHHRGGGDTIGDTIGRRRIPAVVSPCASASGLDHLYDAIMDRVSGQDSNVQSIILLDGMNVLVSTHSAWRTARFLSMLRTHASVRCVIIRWHTDVGSPQERGIMKEGIHATISLEAAWGLSEASHSGGSGALGWNPMAGPWFG